MEQKEIKRQTLQEEIQWEDLFEELKSDVKEELTEIIEEEYSTFPTIIQKEAIDRYIEMSNKGRKEAFFIQAPGGSGKTLAFTIPIVLEAIKNYKEGEQLVSWEEKTVKKKVTKAFQYHPKIVVLCDTKTLSEQLSQEIKKCIPNSYKNKIKITQISAGSTREEEMGGFGDILIILPQIFETFLTSLKDNIILDKCTLMAIDEAEHCYSNSQEKFPTILQKMFQYKQASIICVSATLTQEFKDVITSAFYTEKSTGQLITQDLTLEGVDQYVVSCPQGPDVNYQKNYRWVFEQIIKILTKLYQEKQSDSQVMIFFNEIRLIDEFNDYFLSTPIGSSENKVTFNVIHGRMVKGEDGKTLQKENNQIIRSTFNKFRNYEFKVLLTSDIMARGIDIHKVGLVINVFPPRINQKDMSRAPLNTHTYIHRIARTGRHKQQGVSLTFFRSDNQHEQPDDKIEEEIGKNIKLLKENKINYLKDTQNYADTIIDATIKAVDYNKSILNKN
ncbi:P-loop containing nucleoside triphosphate hydrolase [Pseudocohnilembus persalinus]|uniref:ATP-dependent RNA helicase n=1 Tax=Pseudocohnilembus persalinus TaxID=266149 RepID=A0A0V0QC37_PSEPJ|nr:P-loop containing nucleoside triphosphate hydrolase [Pseudocohnilembus persalinus]|eukprot:KRW99729.1 P-loop containing nucleoside triphosphate hydrolase [Pseudocohnilembus persalinus]